ncbi:MAG: zinc-dependent metalloprotease, partial [Planctomycetota bacterium]
PIVFYVAREVPDKWKPYVKAGIEDWQPAFEQAGFSNAIIGKYAPDRAEDPDWDAEDTRFSTIRWLPSQIPNAFGPHVHDPRTGEILEADVRMYHNVMKLVRDWYFVQAGPSDERAQKLPMPDDLMGELIQFVVAHEVGHSIGLPHNFKVSSSYTIEQLRDPEWTRKNGTASSIMDYARFNYVAQPEDGAGLLPMVGPYDKFSIEWGYKQFPADADEAAELEKIVDRQLDDPMLLWAGGLGAVPTDHTVQTEDLGDDAVEATRLGLKNLERVMGYLVEATSEKDEDYRLLGNMHSAVLGQWRREMGHVAKVVGAVEEIKYYYGDDDQQYFPLDPGKQREAMQFLLDNAFTTPEAFIPDDIVFRLTGQGVQDAVRRNQIGLMRSLVGATRIRRMSEMAERVGPDAFTPAEMMNMMTDGIMSELIGRRKSDPDVYRRNTQRMYVDTLAGLLEDPESDSDRPALARNELQRLMMELDSDQSPHVRDLLARIEQSLDTD